MWILVQDSSKNSGHVGSLYFSKFNTLQLEIKGDIGGGKTLLNTEDKNDPKDGTSSKVELEISDQWQSYEIGLASAIVEYARYIV